MFRNNRRLKNSMNSLERDFLNHNPSKFSNPNLTNWGTEQKSFTQDMLDAKSAFKNEELDYELRNERN